MTGEPGESTYLVVDPGPEAATHIAAAAGILENHPAKLPAHAAGISCRRWVSLTLCVTILGRALRRVDSRGATTDEARGGMRLFKLAA